MAFDDWQANYTQTEFGGGSQYEQGMDLAIGIRNAVGRENLVITGHSLGGGIKNNRHPDLQ